MVGSENLLAVWTIVAAFSVSVTLVVSLLLKPKLAVMLYVLLMPIMQPLMDQVITIPGSKATIGIGGLFQAIILLTGIFVITRSHLRGLRMPAVGIFLVFLLIMAISIMKAPDTIRAMKELGRIAGFTVIYLVAVSSFKSEKDVRQFIIALLLSLVVPFTFGVYEAFTHTGHFSRLDPYNRIPGTFGNAVQYAMFLNFPLLLCLAFGLDKQTPLEKRLLFLCIAGLLSASLFMTYTRSCWFGVMAATIFMGIKKNRGLLFIMPIILFLVLAFVPLQTIRLGEFSTGELSFSGRIRGHTYMLPMVLEEPALGHGITSFVSVATQSDHLRLLLETGLLGYVGFLCLVIAVFKAIKKSYDLANTTVEKNFIFAYMAYFVSILVVGFAETNAFFQYYVWVPAGIVLATSIYKGQEEVHAKRVAEARS